MNTKHHKRVKVENINNNINVNYTNMVIIVIIKTRLNFVYENNKDNKVLIVMNNSLQTLIADK